MNILFLAHRVPFPPNKGEKIRTFNQIKYLHDNGHHISVCAPIEKSDDLLAFEQLQAQYCSNTTYAQLSNKPWRLIKGLLTGKPLSVTNFYSATLQQHFDQLLAQSAIDAIICTSSAMAEYIYHSNTLRNLKHEPKLIMDFMDLDSDKWLQYANTAKWPMSWVYRREAKLLAEFEVNITRTFDTSFFIADAEVTLFKSQARNFGNVLTMGNGMDTELFVPAKQNPNNDAPVFLFTGVMDYKPNIDAVEWFCQAVWPSILAKYPAAQFIIAGMNPTAKVHELANLKGIEITGFVDDILPYYHKSDYFVAPFRIARGVQNKVLQAFACGLPVIATSMGAEGIECESGVHILIANTADEFIEHIAQLEQSTDLRQNIKQHALSLIHQQYSWQGKLQVLLDVLAK